MGSYPKKVKRLLQQYIAEVYEVELHRELMKLTSSFTEWRNSNISSVEMSHRVHKYEKGPSRELYKKYNYGEDAMNVAYPIVTGLLERDQIPPELLRALEKEIGFYQMLKDSGELREPGNN